MKLVILAAGKGTRFYPLTKEVPKGLIMLANKTLLDFVIEPYLNHVSDIIFVINDDLGWMIKDYFGDSYKNHKVLYVVQTKSHKKGTLSALKICKSVIGNDIFCVSNCDDLLLEEDIKNSISQAIPGIGISKAAMPYNYLGIDVKDNFVASFRRHKKEDGAKVVDYFANGFYILTPEVFDFTEIETLDGEVGLPHTLFSNLQNYPLKAFLFHKWQSVNGPENMESAEIFISNLNSQIS